MNGSRSLPSVVRFASLGALLFAAALSAAEPATIAIGTRRELFVDDFLLDLRDGVDLRLHSPTPREVVFVCDAPWEGSGCGYETIFRDGNVIRMYYIAANLTSADGTTMAQRPIFACYAESQDGIRWVKPELGLFEFGGSKRNNIVWSGPGLDNFTPFKDPRPDCRPGERYRAVGNGPGGFGPISRTTACTGHRWRTKRSSPKARSTRRTTPSGTPNANTTGAMCATSTAASVTFAWPRHRIS